MRSSLVKGWLLLVLLSACAGVREDLRRAETAFVEARYEEVDTWLADLTGNVPTMEPAMRARYYYMAGVTAFRLGQKARALHYLRLCREEVADPAARLTEERMRNLELTLAELE